ncbi:MAG TPA: M13 family metallopeptidase [Polyangiaceae bacterium]
MRLRRIPLIAALALPSLASLAVACEETPPPAAPPPITSAPLATSTPAAPPVAYDTSLTGPDIAALDRSVQPCDDFYQFACGGWMKATPIPEDESRWVRSFSVIDLENQKALRGYLERDAAGDTRGDAYGKQLGDFWAACMDEDGIEKRGAADLKPELARIDAVKDAKSLSKELAHLQSIGVRAGFRIRSDADMKDAAHMIAVLWQAGLGMPDRDYYFRDDAHTKDIRAAYEKHVAATFALLGEKPTQAAADAKTVMKMETDLADASMTKVDLRDPQKIYHHTTLAELKTLAPDVDWDAYMAAIGFPAISAFNVGQPDFFKKVDAMTKSVPMRDWKTYLRWHVANVASPTLSKKFVDEWFSFRQTLTGAKTLQPRWKRCVREVDRAMGEALAQPFVKDHLGEDGKHIAESMVAGIEQSMRDDLATLSWMDDATRTQAQAKLAKILNKIGYPAKWRNYDALAPNITRDSYLADLAAANEFETKRQLDEAGKPTDKDEWEMTPPMVNAYYEATLNEMVFPAGILQPPFYVKTQTPAMNFGGIGMVVGHELTHGFDDEGRQYDGDGNLRDWWSAPVSAEFDKRVSCVQRQFDSFVAIDDLHVKGKMTLGEDVGDLGGLKLSYAAFERAEKEHPTTPIRDGFTPEQQFFLGFAQVWCGNYRPEALRLQVQTNEHAPNMFRVNAPVANLPQFAQAFQCKPGDKMVRPPELQCNVW